MLEETVIRVESRQRNRGFRPDVVALLKRYPDQTTTIVRRERRDRGHVAELFATNVILDCSPSSAGTCECRHVP